MAAQLVALDNDALGILLRNLLDNAVKHSPANTPIEVIIDAGAVLRVQNASPVIAPEILRDLNRQYVRGNHAVTGDGLGLYIVSQIISKADGDLKLLSPASGKIDGFEVVVRFVAAEED